jgi:hypothetical protein
MDAWSGHTALVPTTENPEKFGAWGDIDPDRPTIIKTRSEKPLAPDQQSLVGEQEPEDGRDVETAI